MPDVADGTDRDVAVGAYYDPRQGGVAEAHAKPALGWELQGPEMKAVALQVSDSQPTCRPSTESR